MTVRKLIAFVIVAGCAAALSACSEKLTGGAACPRLCPGQNLQVTDTTLRIDQEQPVFDTTVASYPLLGSEGALLSATIPGRALVRAIVRFDSLTQTYVRKVNGKDTTLTTDTVRAAALWFTVPPSTVRATRGSDLIQFQVYNVDTTGADTSVLVLNSLIRPDRYLGGSTLRTASRLADTAGGRVDTVVVPLDSTKILQALKSGRPNVRTAIVAAVTNSATDGVTLNISEATPPFIRYYASDSINPKDTIFARVSASPRSTTPANDVELKSRLIHYPLIIQGADVDSATALNIGGMPARRVYLRFRLPPLIVDSANVIRATLLLTPRPRPVQIPGDTAVVYPQPVIASSKVMEPATAALFAVSSSLYGLDSVKVDPTAPKRTAFDFVNAVRNWQRVSDTLNTRALVLRVLDEGATPLETSFWSSFAPDTANRPHVRIQYVKRSPFALP
jgi:hypothetical protein